MENINRTNLYAGRFSTWLGDIRNALAEGRGIKVSCGECDACCRSSYFIHIKPEETRTLRRISKNLLFPAPLLPQGYNVLGYDKHGRCPMLIGNKCSIYKFSPSTCRCFDCRILSAAGFASKANDRIAQQAQRWKFSYPTKRDRNLLSAVREAASFLARHPECLRNNFAPRDEIQLAVLAIKVYDVFLTNNVSSLNHLRVDQESDIVKKILKSYKKFEKRTRGNRAPIRYTALKDVS
jgi:uncharacterized protein